MDELTSTEFRKTYASLKTETLVTVNGHPIGIWSPSWVLSERIALQDLPSVRISGSDETGWTAKTAQARRDDLLGKINRSK